MPNAISGLKFFARIVQATSQTAVGIARVVLRGIVSIATRLEESLPEIAETMKEVDPGSTYADWAQQYRATVQGQSLEEKLATWNKNTPIDASVMTYQNFRRARKYRYVFAGEVVDEKMGTTEWKMFSMYSNKQLSPQEVKDAFESAYFTSNYENAIRLNDIILKRVQKWTSQKKQ
jgi:hypothetical protein